MFDGYTEPLSRKYLREAASIYRKARGYKPGKKIDPLMELEYISTLFKTPILFEIVRDQDLPKNVHGSCEETPEGPLIKIKQTVYDGARLGVAGYRMDIMHEIAHAILCLLGYRPTQLRDFSKEKIPAYRSCEWQAKALAGEIMIPYEESKGMGSKEIMEIYGVSEQAATFRVEKLKDED